MGRFICHKDGVFFMWSSIVDAPVSHAMTEKQMRERHRSLYSAVPVDARIDRAIKKGTSCYYSNSLEELISHNRAGADETTISLDEIMEQLK